jgi:hypothetical protein
MANKQSFTPAEWSEILESTMLAGVAVSAADPSGLWGTLKEALATRSALASAKAVASSELIKAVAADLETSEGHSIVQEAMGRHVSGAKPAEIVHSSLESLRKVSAILDEKAPDEAASFKIFLLGISHKVAEACTEGAFLGFGGAKISDSEKATLEDIAKSLGTSA